MVDQRSICFYVANLGSKVERILFWKERGDLEAMNNAYERALKIIETIKEFKNLSANKEMKIFKDYLNEIVFDESIIPQKNEFSSYFTPFALRVINQI